MAKWTQWVGGTSSVWSTASNWSNGLPVGADTAVIDGTVSITGGAVTNDEVERVYVARSYTGQIGTTGTPLELDVANLSVDNNASGQTHYLHLTGTLNTTPIVVIDGLKVGTALYLSGDLDRVYCAETLLGTVVIGNSASKTAAIKDLVIRSTAGVIDASVAANLAWTASANVSILAGTLKLGENVGTNSTLTMSGGKVEVSSWTATTGDTFSIHGGVVNWNAGATGVSVASVNAVRTIDLYSGTFSIKDNESTYVGFDNIKQYGGALNFNSSFVNVEIATSYLRYGGEFVPSKQTSITMVAQ